tara:strand:- start:263 stop:967 length:705 start_codon:yes stop_codon:yes gene_type:complete
MRIDIIEGVVARCIPPKAYPEQWDTDLLHEEILRIVGLDLPIQDWANEEGIADEEIRERLNDAANRRMAEKAANYGPEVMRSVEKSLLLQLLDQLWKEHLLTLDHLRQGIGLRAYAQRDPLNEYKQEAFNLFEEMLDSLRERVTQVLCHVELQMGDEDQKIFSQSDQEMHEGRTDPAFAQDEDEQRTIPRLPTTGRKASTNVDPNDPSTWGRVPRNAACPCGSGKKYKHCHGTA